MVIVRFMIADFSSFVKMELIAECVKFLSQMFNLPRKLHFFYCRAESTQRARLARCAVSVSRQASCLN